MVRAYEEEYRHDAYLDNLTEFEYCVIMDIANWAINEFDPEFFGKAAIKLHISALDLALRHIIDNEALVQEYWAQKFEMWGKEKMTFYDFGKTTIMVDKCPKSFDIIH